VNRKALVAATAFGVVAGAVSVLGGPGVVEFGLWGAFMLGTALVLGRRGDGRQFRDGFLIGLGAAVVSTLVIGGLFPVFLAHNPDAADLLGKDAGAPRALSLLLALGALEAIVTATMLGLASWFTAGLVRGLRGEYERRRPADGRVWAAFGVATLYAACLLVPYARPGSLGTLLWRESMDFWLWVALTLVITAWGLMGSLRRRPLVTRWRAFALLLLLASPAMALAIPTFSLLAYPSSHDYTPSGVPFRLPLDGPITVGWGGATPDVNYHVVSPDQRWAYDLTVAEQGQPFRGDGTRLEDYYCYGLPVLAPAGGVVRSVFTQARDMPIGDMSETEHAGGNQIVIEVAAGEFLFLCHLQPGSITVAPGDEVRAGQVLGHVGNSGHTSAPHLHIHLQDSPKDDEGEGIPLHFHRYRLGDRVVQRGIPTGGFQSGRCAGQIVENVDAAGEGRG
jgi:hypothetical protein